jgi:ATP-dependent Clp protease ATP-binding subunit ClpA
MFNRFTGAARTVVARARDEARALGQPHIDTEHLLLGLLDPDAGAAYTVLHAAGLDRHRVRAALTGAGRLLDDEDMAALRTVGIDVDAVLARIEQTFGPGALAAAAPATRRGRSWLDRDGTFSRPAKKVLELAVREAVHLRHNHLGTEHLLLGLLGEGGGRAGEILAGAGVQPAELRAAVLAELRQAA